MRERASQMGLRREATAGRSDDMASRELGSKPADVADSEISAL